MANPILFEYNSKFIQRGDITDYMVTKSIPQSGTVKLTNVYIPLTQDVISAPYNMLTFTELKTEINRKVELPAGNHSLEELCLVMEQVMNSLGGQTYRVTECKGILRIDANDGFRLIFEYNSLWWKLGFLPKGYEGNTHQASLPANLSPSGMYYLDIGIVNRRICTNGFGSGSKDGVFPLLLKGNCYEIAKWKNKTTSPLAIIPNCTSMQVRLFDDRGRLVQLKTDWSFILENIP
jgi:hypothetical protein